MVEAHEKIYADRGPRGGLMFREDRMPDTEAEYTRSDIAERQIAELRAEVVRVRDGNRYFHLERLALDRAEAAEADKARLSEALTEIATRNRSRDQLQEMARAALSGSGAGGWRTMESAPKDGAEFLAALSNGWIEILSGNESVRDNWRYSWWTARGRSSIPYEPTHPADTDWSATATLRAVGWMPLPAAPTGEAS